MKHTHWRGAAVAVALAATMSIPGVVTAQEASPDLSGVQLTVWSIAAPSPAQQAVNDAFTAKTGVTFDWLALPGTGYSQNALTKWQSGDHPDIFWYHAQPNWFLQLQPEQNLQDVSQEAFVQEYAPGLGVGGEVGDQKFGIQLSPPSMYGLIYNKDLMEQAGLTPPTTFDELLGFCADAREKLPDVAPIVMGGGDQWPLQLPAFQWVADAQAADPGLMGAVNRNEVTFSDPRFVDAFAKTKQLLDAGCFNDDVLTATYGDMQTSIMNDEALSLFAGDWFVSDLVAAGFDPAQIDAKLDVSPIGSEAPFVPYGPPFAETNFYLPKTGDERSERAALEYAQFMMGEGYPIYFEQQGGILSCRASRQETTSLASCSTSSTVSGRWVSRHGRTPRPPTTGPSRFTCPSSSRARSRPRMWGRR